MTVPSSPVPDPNAAGSGAHRDPQASVPPGYPSAEDKTWTLVAHFGGATGMLIGGVGGWVAPLIVLLAKGNQSPTVRAHAINALNFQLLWSIIGVIAWLVVWRLPVFLPALAVAIIGVAFGIIGGLRANESQPYNYPMSASLIK
jgi:uncharacterized Tic20 family protein